MQNTHAIPQTAADHRLAFLQSFAPEVDHLGARPLSDERRTTAAPTLPDHLWILAETLGGTLYENGVPDLASIPFYSLCRAVLLPLVGMTPQDSARLFGVEIPPPPKGEARAELLRDFMCRDCGLTPTVKIACLLADPCEGRSARIRRDGMVDLLQTMTLVTRAEVLDRLMHVGDPAILFAESRPRRRSEKALTAAEVLHTLRALPDLGKNHRMNALRSLIQRSGRIEAYFIVRLLLDRSPLVRSPRLLAELIALPWDASPEQVRQAIDLTDAVQVAQTLEREGLDGLRKIRLRPLVPIRPALVSGTTEKVKVFPSWVERKDDGIRLMLHKSTDRYGATLCAAFTRNRLDFTDKIPGIEQAIRAIPASSFILDGELHGQVMEETGPRPAKVHEVMAELYRSSKKEVDVELKYSAFDVIYLDGQDLTEQPWTQRRNRLSTLLNIQARPQVGAIPIEITPGQTAENAADVKRIYQHFRGRGYEGVVVKDPSSAYHLGQRAPGWLKRKPEETLDLVLLAALPSVTRQGQVEPFGTYALGARRPDGSFEEVGYASGLDAMGTAAVRQRILRDGLLTGRRIERRGSTGTSVGQELTPQIVVTVRFSSVIRGESGRAVLRDPQVVMVREDLEAHEVDAVGTLERLVYVA